MSDVRPFRTRVLRSWKEIAEHFQVSVRTVQRWEKELGMPVHREGRRQPMASVDELNLWDSRRREDLQPPVKSQAVPGTRGRWWRILLAALVPCLGLLTYFLWNLEPSTEHAESTPQELEEFPWIDSSESLKYAERWDWTNGVYCDRYLIADVDGDGTSEALVNYFPDPKQLTRGKLQCFEQDGSLRWEFLYGKKLSLEGKHLNEYYVGRLIRLVETPDRILIATSAIHHRWVPCQVALIDPMDGRLIDEYFHPGALAHGIVEDLDGDSAPELILAGVNNPGLGVGHPALLALKIPFSSNAPRGSSRVAELTGRRELFYYLLPRPDVSWITGTLLSVLSLRKEINGRITLQASLFHGEGALYYEFDSELNYLDLRTSDNVPSIHDRFWMEGLLDHRFSPQEFDCLSTVVPFETAPDGNSPELFSLWSDCEFSGAQ